VRSLIQISGPWSKVVLLVLLIALNGLFAMSEIAVISFNDKKLKHLAQEGNRKAQILVRLTGEPSKFLATIQVGVTLSGLMSSAIAADTFVDLIVRAVGDIGINEHVLRMVTIVLITMILAYINLVFGELVPKRIGMNNPEKTSFAVTGILNVTSRIARPFVMLLSASTNGVLRLLGVPTGASDNDVTEEEIRMMIDVGEEDGTIGEEEREMLHNIFDFDDRTVGDVMTHRIDLEALPVGAALKDVIDQAVGCGHSRFPVYEGDLDNIIGVLYIKDMLVLVGQQPEHFAIRDYMRPVKYLPESAKCNDVFEEFRREKVQMAVVVDEYGGTAGAVTMEDLLETIVGSIQDEYDEEEEEIVKMSSDHFLLDGAVLIDDVADELQIKFNPESDFDTIAGFVTDRLRHLPQEGESVEYSGFRFTVTKTEEHRVALIEAVRLPASDTAKP